MTTYTAGIDIGGTKILAVSLKDGETVLESDKQSTGIGKSARPIEDFFATIEKALANSLAKSKLTLSKISAIGVGCAGQVEDSTGDVLDAPHMPWKRMPIKSHLEKVTGKPVFVLNDVQSAAWGEFSLGAGRGARNMVCVFAGTGIGSGIVIEGKLYRGSAGCAGETGHISYRVGGVKCQCGQRGCAEAYGGGESLWLRARKAIESGKKTMIADMIDSLDKIPADVIHAAAVKGDPVAKKLWKDAELAIATIVHHYVDLLNPDTLILGGGIVEGLPYLRDFVRCHVEKRCVRTAARTVNILAPKLGGMSSAAGGANYAWAQKR